MFFHDEESFVVEETDPTNSIVISDLPSRVHGDTSSIQDAIDTENGGKLLWLENNGYLLTRDVKRVRPPTIPHEDARYNRVCWLAKVIC